MSWRSKTYALSYSGQRGSRKKDPSKDSFLSKHLPQSPSLVLDAGGRNGWWSLGLSELGYKVCLVDFNLYMLKMAKNLLKNTGVHIVLSDIRFLPFRSETFDLVFCEADPISQCGSKRAAIDALKEMFSILKKRSILAGSITNRFFWVIKMISEAKDHQDLENILHLLDSGVYKPKKGYRMYLFTPNEFKEVTLKIGFRCLESIPYIGLIASQFISEGFRFRESNSRKVIDQIENKLV